MLKEKLGKKRIILNDDQRRRLAVKGKVLGRKVLQEIGCLVHARHDPPLAPGTGRPEMGLQPPAREEAGTAADLRGDHPTGRADGPGESRVGATTASSGHWPTWGTRSPTKPSATS